MSDLSVIIRPSPLRSETRDLHVTAGLTLAEIVGAALPDQIARDHAYVEIKGTPIPPAMWPRIRVKEGGGPINIVVVPAGGGNVLQFSLAVGLAATVATGGLLAGAGLPLWAATGAAAATPCCGRLAINLP